MQIPPVPYRPQKEILSWVPLPQVTGALPFSLPHETFASLPVKHEEVKSNYRVP
jgi:hypothetical protein